MFEDLTLADLCRRGVRAFLFLGFVGLCGMGAYLAYLDKTGPAAVVFAASFLCLIFAFLPDFKRFKGLGIEAELLDRKIKEADEVISVVRDISLALTEIIYISASRSGMMDSSFSEDELYNLTRRVDVALIKCGVDSVDINRLKSCIHDRLVMDISRSIGNKIIASLRRVGDEGNRAAKEYNQGGGMSSEELARYRDRQTAAYKEIDGVNKILSRADVVSVVSDLKAAISTSKALSPERKSGLFGDIKAKLDELEYYEENRRVRVRRDA